MSERDPILGGYQWPQWTKPKRCGQAHEAEALTQRSKSRRQFCVKSKAAILALCWNFCITLVFTSILDPIILLIAETTSIDQDTFTHAVGVLMPSFCACTAFLYLFYPLAGYLADTRCGRYKTIIYSLCSFTVLFLVAIVIAIVVTTCLHLQNSVSYAFLALLLPPFPSYIFFSANIIQFGMDQLYDSPMEDSVLFIHWFVLTSYLAFVFFKAVALVVVQSGIGLVLFGLATLVVTLCIAWCKKQWFLVDSGARVQRNPYTLIVKVIKFARRHRAPIRRSAFTYCEDELPSRFDLGKEKYGGPFSTEEVEDVKAFLGIFCVLLTFWSVFATDIARNGLVYGLSYHLDDCWYSSIFAGCGGENVTFSNYFLVFKNYVHATLKTGILSDLLIVIFILFYIYLLRPLVCRAVACCIRCYQGVQAGMLNHVGFGMIFLSISLLSTLILDVVKHEIHPNETCLLRSIPNSNENYNSSSHFISEWYLVIPFTFNALGYTLFYTAAYEFICAQSPHAMKGLIIGTFFAIKGIFQLIGALIVLPFSTVYTTLHPSCGSTYYLVTVLISLIGIVVYVLVARRYKYRQRDEPDNIYRYAEDYYSKDHDEEEEDEEGVGYSGSYDDLQSSKTKLN